MYSGTNVEGSDTEMGEELSKSICNPQSDQPTQRLDCDRPGFTTLVTRARSYTLPNPMINQTKVTQGFINPERIEIRGQRSPASSPNHSWARQKTKRISTLSTFYTDPNLYHEAVSYSNKNDDSSTGPRLQSLRPISNPTQAFLASTSKSIASQVGVTSATAFRGG